jgi:cell division protease FtsH
LNLLLGFGPTILLIVGFWLTNRAGQAAGGGLFGIGRSRAKRYDAATGALAQPNLNTRCGC